MIPKTIAMFNLTETRRDPRVRRIAGTLASQGHRVIVFGMKSEVYKKYERLDNFEVVRVDIPLLYSEKEMKQIGISCPDAEGLLMSCNPLVLTEKIGLLVNVKRLVSKGLRKILNGQYVLGNRGKFDQTQEILAIRSIMLINLNLYCSALEFKPDIIHCNDLDTLIAGFMLKKRLKKPLIFDAHEIYPEQLAEHMRSEIWHNFYTKLEKKLLPYTDGRLTVCDSLGQYFKKVYKSGEFKTIRNVVSIKHLPDTSILKRSNKPVRILYHGAYFPYRGLDEIIQSAPLVNNAIFIFRGIGHYEEKLRSQVKDLGMEKRVFFEPPVKVDELVSAASENDIGLNPFISVCKNTEYALPNKFFEYMMAGLAVASSDLIEMRLLTNKLGIGTLLRPDSPQSIADSLNELVDSPEKLSKARYNAYMAAMEEYNWEQEQVKLIDYYKEFIDI